MLFPHPIPRRILNQQGLHQYFGYTDTDPNQTISITSLVYLHSTLILLLPNLKSFMQALEKLEFTRRTISPADSPFGRSMMLKCARMECRTRRQCVSAAFGAQPAQQYRDAVTAKYRDK